MTKFILDDEDTRLLKQMEDVGDSMSDMINDLCGRTMYPDRDMAIQHMETALRELATAQSIFFTDNVYGEDQWIKKDET